MNTQIDHSPPQQIAASPGTPLTSQSTETSIGASPPAASWVQAQTHRLLLHFASEAPGTLSKRQLEAWQIQVSRLQAALRGLALLMHRGQHIATSQQVLEATCRLHKQVTEFRPSDFACAAKHVPAAPVTSFQSAYIRQNEYWTVGYAGQTALLKSTRGLECLCCLLRNPRREFHVSELIATLPKNPAATELSAFVNSDSDGHQTLAISGLNDGCPVLDAQARNEYRKRLTELREELADAEQFNDPYRASKAHDELEALTQHLAAAVGLGGRDRKTSSDAERARSTVTKRIKRAICSIGEAIPPLGDHLGTRIKTGYFCSYLSPVDEPVSWRF